MTPRRAAVVGVVMLALTAGCGRGRRPSISAGPTSTVSDASASPSSSAVPQLSSALPSAAAVDAATRFQLSRCGWSWDQPRSAYIARQQSLAAPGHARVIAAESDAAQWQREVIADRQVVTCRARRARLDDTAPNTATVAFVRVSSTAHVVSALGSFDTGTAHAAWRLELRSGRWLVTGPFQGG